MALEFTDFGLSPEEKVATRKKALESYSGIAGEALQDQQAREKGQLLTQAYLTGAKSAQAGQPGAATPMLADVQQKAAEMLPQQAAKMDAANLAGAKMREDIIGSKQQAALVNYETQTDQMKQQLAQQTANRAFELGMNSRQIALANESYLSDYGLRQLYADLEAGRANKEEVWKISSQLAMQAKELEYQIAQEKETLSAQLSADLSERNFDAARARIKRLLAKEKEALTKAAKASSMAAILSGGVELGVLAVSGSPGAAKAAGKITTGAVTAAQ